uniref:Odorant binding protein n=1 Tax=Heliothis virescens TaxID=7102 RepID=A0A2A4IZ10_HELVI
MFKLCVFLGLSVALCYGAPGRGVACGKVPGTVYKCLAFPSDASRDILPKCKLATECEKLTCTFREYNLLDDEVINRERALAFFENYTRENATFTAAVEHIKSECLGSVALKPQGIYLDCPVYDVLYCVFRNLIRHAAPAQWSTTPECKGARAFAAACPICPDECFKPEVPAGSCNAC